MLWLIAIIYCYDWLIAMIDSIGKWSGRSWTQSTERSENYWCLESSIRNLCHIQYILQCTLQQSGLLLMSPIQSNSQLHRSIVQQLIKRTSRITRINAYSTCNLMLASCAIYNNLLKLVSYMTCIIMSPLTVAPSFKVRMTTSRELTHTKWCSTWGLQRTVTVTQYVL